MIAFRLRWLRSAALSFCAVAVLGACALGYNQRAPEVLYSSKASSNKSLQVPPDLTDISDGEQFVLPGNSAGAVRRNTLLPSFQDARFRRDGASSWLELAASPEALWPELLSFVRRQGLTVLRTEPVNGLIETEWAPAVSDSGGSVFRNLLGGDEDELYQRIALRMERADNVTRLFSRVQQLEKKQAVLEGANQRAWPQQKPANPESVNLLLQRLLVHLGVAEQRAKGILDEASAALIFDAATLERTAGGTQLVVHRGYHQSQRSVVRSLAQLGYRIISNDSALGQIRVAAQEGESAVYLFKLDPVHVSAVKVAVRNAQGEPVEPSLAESLLQQIREQLV